MLIVIKVFLWFNFIIWYFLFKFIIIVIVYNGDESFVPKNTTVVVKRIPVPPGTGLLTRLNATAPRGHSL